MVNIDKGLTTDSDWQNFHTGKIIYPCLMHINSPLSQINSKYLIILFLDIRSPNLDEPHLYLRSDLSYLPVSFAHYWYDKSQGKRAKHQEIKQTGILCYGEKCKTHERSRIHDRLSAYVQTNKQMLF